MEEDGKRTCQAPSECSCSGDQFYSSKDKCLEPSKKDYFITKKNKVIFSKNTALQIPTASRRLRSQIVRRVLMEVPKSVRATELVPKSVFPHSSALLGILANKEGRTQVMTGTLIFSLLFFYLPFRIMRDKS